VVFLDRYALSYPRLLVAEADHSYLAVSPEAVLRPELRPAWPATLDSPNNSAEYLLVAPREFLGLASAVALLEQRRAQGLSARGVAIEDVFDEFGHGEARPEAVKEFLSYAYHSWPEPSPRYVLLLGDATYDPEDNLNTGTPNHVPAYPLQTTYMWTASDPAYAAVNGDDLLPDLAIGRLPATNLEQARVMLDKVLAYENGGWNLDGPAVLVADNPDHAGDFEADAEWLAAGVLADRDPEKIYLSQLGAATRPTIIDAFDRGASLLSYIGHGAILLWASENVFNFADVANLSPQPQQPPLPLPRLPGRGAGEGGGQGGDRDLLPQRHEPERSGQRLPRGAAGRDRLWAPRAPGGRGAGGPGHLCQQRGATGAAQPLPPLR
jgi:hypothetical protein